MWGLCPDEYSNTTVEVIGNIHDNPELIGGDSDAKRGICIATREETETKFKIGGEINVIYSKKIIGKR
jgi:hypothetical protein